ncbi:MAG: hypothetical protein C0459_03030 [Chitinophaga sp.]|jgi:hypothetical protein|nr:hypothetical protein [Chitinophaga sp.]
MFTYVLKTKWLIFLLIVVQAKSQQSSLPPTEWQDSFFCKNYRGVYTCVPSCYGNIVKNNGDTIQNSYMRVWGNNTLVYNSKYPNYPINISNSDIKFIYTTQKEIFGNNRTELVHLPYFKTNWLFWRVIRSKDNITIYDLVCKNTFTSLFSYKMILKVKNKYIIKLCGYPKGVLGTIAYFLRKDDNQYSHDMLLKLIHLRYHLNLSKSDFKNNIDIIDLILSKENEKLNKIN